MVSTIFTLLAVLAYPGYSSASSSIIFASSRTEKLLRGLPMLKILPRGDAVRVLDDLHQRVDAVVDVGEGALLLAAVDQLDRLAAHDVAEELRDHARAAFLRRVDLVELGPIQLNGRNSV